MKTGNCGPPCTKNKERELIDNYRPISLLLTISKILEKLVYKRVYDFMCETKQIFNSQYGFRAGHSCENAISEVLGEIVEEPTKSQNYDLCIFGPFQGLR